ncbi:non-specific lipid-transfer protein 1-like [Impatiens glandulifera]|uniref:non-specific lipid-transfer protein 1-like n=1 Tax=Impatiens glandulifera TaxID=253017 RepID=UPI001FB172ED|nr:non-specific lipid-transfer protein 1-like [Impatiens glandulifera]
MVMMSAKAAVTCNDVTNDTFPCLSYASSGGAQVPSSCCAGVTRLNNAAQTTPDRQTACNCLKNLARTFSFKFAGDIPDKCGISIPYKIDPNTDCTKVT